MLHQGTTADEGAEEAAPSHFFSQPLCTAVKIGFRLVFMIAPVPSQGA